MADAPPRTYTMKAASVQLAFSSLETSDQQRTMHNNSLRWQERWPARMANP